MNLVPEQEMNDTLPGTMQIFTGGLPSSNQIT